MIGVDALGTRSYCVNMIMFVYLFCISIAQGGAICIGRLVGAGRNHAAYLCGKYVMKKAVGFTLLFSLILAISGPFVVPLLTDNTIVINLACTILWVDVLLEVGRPINIYATAALRSAGDVYYPFYVGVIVQWLVAVGIGYVLGVSLMFGIVGMWVAFVLDENIRGIIFVRRWNSRKWMNKAFVNR